MIHTISEKCTGCGLCFDHCPVDCVIKADIYKIDPEMCIDCGVCAVVCPVKAVISDINYFSIDNE